MRPSRSLLLTAAAIGLAACGSSSQSASSIKPNAMVTFAKCMRANGVPSFPDPGSNGNGGLIVQKKIGSGASLTVNGVSVSSPAFQAAMQACHSKLPNGGHPPALSAGQRSAMLKFSQCMRANGVTNFPDPTFGPGGRIGLRVGPQGGLDPNSPAFQRAQATCAKYRGGAATAKVP
jgi:hypothetical protein